jgi:transcriptional regulator with XRE-family HTH domain
MNTVKFVLIDVYRADLFSRLDGLPRRLDKWSCWIDAEGVHWAARQIGHVQVAISSIGPAWTFDPYARGQWADEYRDLLKDSQNGSDRHHEDRLNAIVHKLRLGQLGVRLLFAIHAQLLAAKCSVFKVSDAALGEALWGRDRKAWPRHWRKDVLAIAGGFGWLHLADEASNDCVSFGTGTALLTHFSDLRGTDDDCCDPLCAELEGRNHHHFLVNVGRGFLGILEAFARADDNCGVRYYRFPTRGKPRQGSTLRQVGKTGRLVSCFLPAELGDPTVCNSFTRRQLRLFHAINREATRARGRSKRDPSAPAVFAGNLIPDLRGRRLIACTLLTESGRYVAFNGNSIRRGLGYYLTTPGGLLAKAGYPLGDVQGYLADLAVLEDRLELVSVGIHKSTSEIMDLDSMMGLALTTSGKRVLDQLFVRVYGPGDFADRWATFFAGPKLPARAVGEVVICLTQLSREMARKGIRQRTLALGLGIDPSFLSKVFGGKKRPPKELLERAAAWIADRPDRQPPPLQATIATISGPSTTSQSAMLDVALAYLRRGWSVVPQVSGAKNPLVKWKTFQIRHPTDSELQTWFRRWPRAGLVVILGQISDLFAIDVDGEDAHAVLIQRLRTEPVAPKTMSGSGNPFRYHLFFRHPAVPTKAKITPWHPKLEFRGNRGIVVIAPSLHSSGNRYAWALGRSLEDLPIPEVPPEVLAALLENVSRRNQAPVVPAAPVLATAAMDPSNATREFMSGKYANGPNWNSRLFAAACDLNARGMTIERAQPLLLAAARPWDDSESDTAVRTIRSAYSQPRTRSYC